MKLRKNQIISPKILTISSGGNQKYLPSYLGNSSGETEMSSFLQCVSPVSSSQKIMAKTSFRDVLVNETVGTQTVLTILHSSTVQDHMPPPLSRPSRIPETLVPIALKGTTDK